MSSDQQRNECREWTCPLHGAENQRLDKRLLSELTGPTKAALDEIERAFSQSTEEL